MMVDTLIESRVDRRATSAASILNFLVDDKKTIRESLAGSKGLTGARDLLVAAAKDQDVIDKARTLCRAIVAEAETVGLAPVDAGAVAWAYLADLAFSAPKYGNARKGCSEVEHFPHV